MWCRSELSSAFEYETIWANGANCGIDDLDVIAQIDRLCDDFGLDTIEMGCAVGVAMAGGIKAFGDGAGAIELINEIGKGTPLGRVIGSGAAVTGQVFGVEDVPVVKRQGLPAYDPRAVKGTHPGPDGIFGNDDDIAGSMGVVKSDHATNTFVHGSVFFPEVEVTGRKTPPSINAGSFDTRP